MKYIIFLSILAILIISFSISGCTTQINNNELIHEIDESIIIINEYLDNIKFDSKYENNTAFSYKLRTHCNDEISWLNSIIISNEVQNIKQMYSRYLNNCINLSNHIDDYTKSDDIVYLYISLDEIENINLMKKDYEDMKKGYYTNLSVNSNENIYIIDMCTADPKNKQIWKNESILLYKKPGEFNYDGQEIVGILPTCDKVEVIKINSAEVNGNIYYEVVCDTQSGWISGIIFDLFTSYKEYQIAMSTPIPTIKYLCDPDNSEYIIAYDQTTGYIPADLTYNVIKPPMKIEYEATTNEIEWEKAVFEKWLDKPGEWVVYNQTFANPDARFYINVIDEPTGEIIDSSEIEFFDTKTEINELNIHIPGNFIIKMSGNCIDKLKIRISMPKENKVNLPLYK